MRKKISAKIGGVRGKHIDCLRRELSGGKKKEYTPAQGGRPEGSEIFWGDLV